MNHLRSIFSLIEQLRLNNLFDFLNQEASLLKVNRNLFSIPTFSFFSDRKVNLLFDSFELNFILLNRLTCQLQANSSRLSLLNTSNRDIFFFGTN